MSKVPVNKTDIIELVAEQAEISKTAATKAFNTVLESITAALRGGKGVSLLGFGTFSVKSRAARVGRNPKTGEPINIEAANVPVFKAGKALKDAVNSGTVVLEEEQL
ncbi:MAG TPA: HU family DNA-binding protein [Candidatus Berkiella sp.]|uniref:DNA-binding protein HU-beta n=1 Tax=Candidatus Berkiella aquae TaxID=295108 RepID=A0A0Q9YIK0_9GAMM|nr:HU family DNA-binding protein [Candidatus Berkiella aquae]MCS5711724.1 HU family DNA-binding protein [Candidatus Berkiella aquae]HRE33407.1 HU family DNA-binding protein [Candidatus Berkiella sp.]